MTKGFCGVIASISLVGALIGVQASATTGEDRPKRSEQAQSMIRSVLESFPIGSHFGRSSNGEACEVQITRMENIRGIPDGISIALIGVTPDHLRRWASFAYLVEVSRGRLRDPAKIWPGCELVFEANDLLAEGRGRWIDNSVICLKHEGSSRTMAIKVVRSADASDCTVD